MAVKLPVFDSCCCCVDLRIGSLIIGYAQLVTHGITLVFSLILLIAGITLVGDPEHRENGYILLVFSILMLSLLIPIFCFTIFLVYGMHKGKPQYVLAYLLCAAALLFVALVSIFISFFVQNSDAIIMDLIFCSLEIYLLLVIRSYYLRMISGDVDGST